jgi:alpha-galactosidase
MVQKTPPMGWNSWNTFGNDISEKLIYETADAMVETGLAAAGYRYLVIDDCWHEAGRDENGRMIPDAKKFPNGMKAVADYVHAKGLKFGMYSCAGNFTCAGLAGSFGHEFTDARTFAEWGVDYLKYDYCFKPSSQNGPLLYRRMGAALANCGREILFNACSWGADDTKSWIKTTGSHAWRSTGDINDSWQSIKSLAEAQIELQPYNAINCFNDMDMLVVGMYGKGNVAVTGCTDTEYKTHFSLWSVLNSNLIIGCDVRSMSEATREILTNAEIIAINQDPACRQPYLADGDRGCLKWVKLLDNGDLAIGLFNFTDGTRRIFLPFADLGLDNSCGVSLSLCDLWEHKELGVFSEQYCSPAIEAHGCQMLRAKLIVK